MIKTLEKVSLAPGLHRDAVDYFMDFFRLPAKQPGLRFLHEILRHFSKIPYENISKIIKLNQEWDSPEKVRLPEEVMADHRAFRLGGTCFSLTFFLQNILGQHSFVCYPVMADMKAGRNIHCCLIVVLDACKYLVDPGYLLTRPMEIKPHKPRLYRTEFTGVELRFDRDINKYDLFTFSKSGIKWRYRFEDRPVAPDQFRKHWLASFGWNSMHGICLTKVTKGGLIFVHKDFMRETSFDSKRNYRIKRNYHATIHDIFGIEKDLIGQAQVALDENMKKERDLGLWLPKKERISQI